MPSPSENLTAAQADLDRAIADANAITVEIDTASAELTKAKRASARKPSKAGLETVASLRAQLELLEDRRELQAETIGEARAAVAAAQAACNAEELQSKQTEAAQLQQMLDELVASALAGMGRITAVKEAHDSLLARLTANTARQRALGAQVETPDQKQFSRKFARGAQVQFGISGQDAAQSCLAYFHQLV